MTIFLLERKCTNFTVNIDRSIQKVYLSFFFQMSIVANDNSNPARTGFVEAFITVIRDQFPPFFINTPYAVTIDEYTGIGASIFNVNATDNDLVVSCLFITRITN